MADISGRNRQQNELAAIGYSLRYIDDYGPRTKLYRHKPSYSLDGSINEEVGSFVAGVPGNPEYVLSKAKIGLFAWPPNQGCTCQWCNERMAQASLSKEVTQEAPEEDEVRRRGVKTS